MRPPRPAAEEPIAVSRGGGRTTATNAVAIDHELALLAAREIEVVRQGLYAGFMNLQVAPELEANLTRLAAEAGRTADQVALDLLASSIDQTSGSAPRSKMGASPHVKAGCSSTMTPLLAWIGDIAADARPLDD